MDLLRSSGAQDVRRVPRKQAMILSINYSNCEFVTAEKQKATVKHALWTICKYTPRRRGTLPGWISKKSSTI